MKRVLMLNRKKLGFIIIALGMIWLYATGSLSFFTLSSLKLGPLEVQDISEPSAINLFIGFGIMIIGTVIYLRNSSDSDKS